MARNKSRIVISGLDEYMEKLRKLDESILKPTVEKALLETHKLITDNIKRELAKYNLNRTGELKASFREEGKVWWLGEAKGLIEVGFDQSVSKHAIYLMITGTPYRKPDQELYNATYGNRNKVTKLQKEILEEAIREAMK